MSAGSKAATRNAGLKPQQGFDWQGGALIQCIDWLGGTILITQIISGNPSWFGFVFQFPCDGVQRSCHLLVRCDKTPKKSQEQDDDAYNASEIDEHKKSAK
jgi:hypothetical protein